MGKVSEWLRGTNFLVYSFTTLTNWGDRMWSFAVALFLIKLSPDSLRLTALYGLSCGGAVLLFGPIIGDWVDRNPRLRVARTTLILQNSFVATSAILIMILLSYHADLLAYADGALVIVFQAGVIAVAVLARLAGTGCRISVQKDWIMEICDRDKNKLAVMVATIRRLDLFMKIAAPICTGQIMAFTSNKFACGFISAWNVVSMCVESSKPLSVVRHGAFAWNVVSMCVEYFLMTRIYYRVPALAHKIYKHKTPKPEKSSEEKPSPSLDTKNTEEHKLIDEDKGDNPANESEKFNRQLSNPYKECEKEIDPVKQKKEKVAVKETSLCNAQRLCVGFFRLFNGWRTYMKYRVAFAGVGLACLYMTVLGFDNITMGYAYSQGVSEWVLGIVMAFGAVIGVGGTFAYPIIRKKVGLERTGLFSFTFQIMSLTLCVAAIWLPGSPFHMFGFGTPVKTGCNDTLVAPDNSTLPYEDLLPFNESDAFNSTTDPREISNMCAHPDRRFESIIILLTGITFARFGLWVTDLTITQLQLENVHETERGVVNGVQISLNMLLDMIKFGLVVFLPNPPEFGYLVMLSFLSIMTGGVSYCCYTYRVRKHILPHFSKLGCGPPLSNGHAHVENGGVGGDRDDGDDHYRANVKLDPGPDDGNPDKSDPGQVMLLAKPDDPVSDQPNALKSAPEEVGEPYAKTNSDVISGDPDNPGAPDNPGYPDVKGENVRGETTVTV